MPEPRPIRVGQWRVDITIRPGAAVPVARVALARAVARAVEAGGSPSPASIALVLSNDAELAELNATHLGGHGATDVLSFPMLPPEAFPPHPGATGRRAAGGRSAPSVAFPAPPGRRLHLGDIAVSVERAIVQAEAGRGGQAGDLRWAPADELRLLVTHGTLHLCGWDHAEPAEEAAMRDLERRLLAED